MQILGLWALQSQHSGSANGDAVWSGVTHNGRRITGRREQRSFEFLCVSELSIMRLTHVKPIGECPSGR